MYPGSSAMTKDDYNDIKYFYYLNSISATKSRNFIIRITSGLLKILSEINFEIRKVINVIKNPTI